MIFSYICLIIAALFELVTCQWGYSLIPTMDPSISPSFEQDVSEAFRKSANSHMGSTPDSRMKEKEELLKEMISLAEKYERNNSDEEFPAATYKKITKRSSEDDSNESRTISSVHESLVIPRGYQRLRPQVRPVIPESGSHQAEGLDQLMNHPSNGALL